MGKSYLFVPEKVVTLFRFTSPGATWTFHVQRDNKVLSPNAYTRKYWRISNTKCTNTKRAISFGDTLLTPHPMGVVSSFSNGKLQYY